LKKNNANHLLSVTKDFLTGLFIQKKILLNYQELLIKVHKNVTKGDALNSFLRNLFKV